MSGKLFQIIVKEDAMIRYGNYLMQQGKPVDWIRQRLHTLAWLLDTCCRISNKITDMTSLLRPQEFKTFLEAVKYKCEESSKKGYKASSVSFYLGQSLFGFSSMALKIATDEKNEKSVKNIKGWKKLYMSEFSNLVMGQTKDNTHQSKRKLTEENTNEVEINPTDIFKSCVNDDLSNKKMKLTQICTNEMELNKGLRESQLNKKDIIRMVGANKKSQKESNEKKLKEKNEKTQREIYDKRQEDTDEEKHEETDEETQKETNGKTPKEINRKTQRETNRKTQEETDKETQKETNKKRQKGTSEKRKKETNQKNPNKMVMNQVDNLNKKNVEMEQNQIEVNQDETLLFLLARDVKKLKDYTKRNIKTYSQKVKRDFSLTNWHILANNILVSLIMFNLKCVKDIQTLLATEYAKRYVPKEKTIHRFMMTPSEQLTSSLFKRVDKSGKVLLINCDVEEAISTLFNVRNSAGVSKDNPYLFGIGEKSFIEVTSLVQKFVVKAQCDYPHFIIGPVVRKHISALVLATSLSSDEMNKICYFMEHKLETSGEFYRVPNSVSDIVRMSQFLVMLDNRKLLGEMCSKNLLEVIKIMAREMGTDASCLAEFQQMPCSGAGRKMKLLPTEKKW